MSIALLLVLLYASLRRQPNPVQSNSSPTDAPALPDLPADRVLPLPLISADATAPDSRIGHLFDQDPATLWLLSRGSGPGSCLELHFLPQDMPFLSGIRAVPAAGDSLTGITKMALYVNNELTQVKEGDFDFPIGQKVFALRLCIEETGGDQVQNYAANDELISIRTMPQDQQTALQSLLFFDREGLAYYPLPPRFVAANVTPSSNLNPVSAFHAGRLFDGRPAGAWIEGEAATSVSTIRVRLAEAVQPSALVLWNGYQLSDIHYQNNSRVAALTLHAGNQPPLELECRDQSGAQILDLPSNLRLEDFSLEIDQKYPGSRYPETAISELCFLEGARSVILQTNWPRTVRGELELKTDQSPLYFYLDRSVSNRIEHRAGDYLRQQQLCIRSDGSFYARQEQNQARENTRTQYEISGHWGLREARAEYTRIQLFGKLVRVRFGANSTPIFEETLFEEEIEFLPDRIVGGERLGTFYLR